MQNEPSYPSLHVVHKDLEATALSIQRLARRYEPALRAAFLAAIRSARRQATLDTIVRALETYDPAAAIREATAGVEYETMKETLAQIVEAAGVKTTNALSADIGPIHGHLLASFNVVNYHAVRYAREKVGRMIAEIDFKTKEGVARVVANAMEFGGDPYQQAKQIRGMVGLTEYQTNYVLNYENKLLAAGATDVDAKVQRYADKVLGQRSLVIARTETLSAATGGQQAAWKTAIDQGFLDAGVEQEWIITNDERTCPLICEPMPDMPENQHVTLDDMFTGGDGSRVAHPPIHPACRCAISLRL